MRGCSIIFSAALVVSAVPAAANTLTVEDVVALSDAKLGDEAIVAKIRSDGQHFDLSPQQMIELRQRGLSSAVIAAMLATAGSVASTEVSMNSPDPTVPHPPGLYALVRRGSAAQMVRIDPTSTSQMKTGGVLGYALTGGLAGMSMKVAITNQSARVRTSLQPTFYFFFDESRAGANSSSFMGASFAASSPNEFSLVQLDQKGDHRETKVGKVNIGGAKVGVMDRDRVEFRYDAIRPGVFMVTPVSPLRSGEYGFLYSLPGAGMGGAMTARIFDFGAEAGVAEPVRTAVPQASAAPTIQSPSEVDALPRSAPTTATNPSARATSAGTSLPKGIHCVTCR